MKDLVISSKRLKKEILIIAICFIVASIINIISVIIYKTPWYEIFTQVGYVIVITLILYLFIIIVRLFVSLDRRIVIKKNVVIPK